MSGPCEHSFTLVGVELKFVLGHPVVVVISATQSAFVLRRSGRFLGLSLLWSWVSSA